jgi:ubiquinone/menaquinone biosynthesis C-methylase UbiE
MTERQNDQPSIPNIGSYNDVIAGMYDEATAAQGWSINELVAERLKDYSGRNPAVLDLGAGTGQTVGVVLEEVDASRIIAVDASSNMLKHLRRKYPLPIVETVESSIEDYVRSSQGTFDLITAIGSLEFVRDLPANLGQLALRLRPNGRLLATYIQRKEAGIDERTFQVPSLGQAFTEYYWAASTVRDSLVSQGVEVVEEFAVPAYQRGDETVEYTFMSVTNPHAAN